MLISTNQKFSQSFEERFKKARGKKIEKPVSNEDGGSDFVHFAWTW